MSENNQKIKSIKVKQDQIQKLDAQSIELLETVLNNIFQIEYEKPKILKRPDGSVISGLEEGQKVISIKTYNAEYSSNIANITENKENIIIEYEDNVRRLGHFKKAIFAKDEVEIEYEKPKILKRPDGSVISGLENGQEIWIISQYDSYFLENDEWDSNSHYLNTLLKEGRIFLIQDIHLAEKKAKMLTKQLEIQYEIDRLNAEEYDEINQKYGIFQFGNSEIDFSEVHIKNGQTKMSEKTAETILAKYTQDELKQFLGIII